MKKILLSLLILSGFVLYSQAIYAQTGVRGVVKDATYSETLIGATVILEGTSHGVATNMDGRFQLEGPAGDYKMKVTYVGYEEMVLDVTIVQGKLTNLGDINLVPTSTTVDGVMIQADRAIGRETPVAFSNVDRKQIQEQLGSRDIPLSMDVTPNVYATPQGGGSGDARINVRGFNQRNVAIMINGVPINDMENGWVYWSNWDGIGDAASSIQMQRGLSAVNLATPSIGGTMNVITSPAEQKGGFNYKQEFGTGNFIKSSVFAHTGLIDNKFAFSVGGVRKTGQGVVDKVWTDAWAYYLGASWNINSKHRLELYAMGAPQRHGQNLYKQNIAAYSHDYAKELDYPAGALDKFPESQSGRLYNENWGTVSNKYTGNQNWNGTSRERFNPHYINERENFYHKPLVNMNWFAQFSEKVSLYTTLYYSGGKGGGTGTYGDMAWDYSGPSRMVDFDGTIEDNESDEWGYKEKVGDSTIYGTQPIAGDQAVGILRNSVNNQNSVGVLSKLKWNLSDRSTFTFGIDGRTATIEHYREIRDLVGGNYFSTRDLNGNRLIKEIKDGDISYEFPENEFWPAGQVRLGLGDKLDYNFTNTVQWLGGFVQYEYNYGNVTAYGTAGYSMIKYGYTNHFKKEEGTESELKSNSDWIGGYQIKGGANYRFTETINAFVNLGYVSKVPVFDAVINDRNATVAADPKNENFTSAELGATYKSINNKFIVSLNGYYTMWDNRTVTESIRLDNNNEGLIFIEGMSQKHLGLEIEGRYKVSDAFGFLFAGSINNWEYTKDVTGEYKDYSNPDEDIPYNYYINGLKVGDAPQTQLVVGIDVYPLKQWKIQLLAKYYGNHWSDFDPLTRDDETDTDQVWKTPGYTVFDMHTEYNIPVKGDLNMSVFLHIFNLFDEIYVQDAVDNSSYNAYRGENGEYSHEAWTSEVFLGLPRVFNFGVVIGL